MSSLEHKPLSPDAKPALGADLIIPVLAGAFTIYFIASTSNLTWEARANGVVIGVALLAMIAIQLVRIGLRVARGQATLGLGDLADTSSVARQRIALVGLTALFIATIPWLGTAIGLFLTMAAMMWLLGERSPKTLVWVSAATAVTTYLLFIAFLGTRLPRGPFENLISWMTDGRF